MTNLVTGIADMVKHHLQVSPLVYRYKSETATAKQDQEMYIVKSIKRTNQSYIVVFENNQWACDCPSFKYHSGVDSSGNCKHIRLIIFLKSEHVEIKEI